MDRAALALGEQWERELGDPWSPQGRINFHSALELDEGELFPQAHLDALLGAGLFEFLIPARDGGRLQQPEQAVLLGRIVSRRDLTTAIAFGQTLLGSLPVWLAGTTEQKALLAQGIRAGNLGCLALTEKEHGSDILSNELAARAEGEQWRLNGSKWLINNGRMGRSATVLGRIERPGRSPEMALWWLRKEGEAAERWRPHPKIRTHGIRGADISGFELRDHLAGGEALLKGGEPALYTVLKTLQMSRVLCSGFSLGAVDTLFKLTFEFARDRKLYGKRAIDIPVVQANLARCYARVLAADLVAQIASRAIVAAPQELSLLSAIAKYHVPTEAEEIGRDLAVVLGARHYVRSEYPWGVFQKMMRDNQVVSLFDGSTQVNLGLIAAQLRALGDQLAGALEGAGSRRPAPFVEQLVVTRRACEGWPAQTDLRLNNQGQDSVVSAFFTLCAGLRDEGPCAAAIARLQAHWQAWIRDCQQATGERRLPLDSVPVMELARRYVTLHSCAAVVLGWKLNRPEDAPMHRLDDDVLLCYLACKLPGGDELPAELPARLLHAAGALVEGRRLLSLHDVALA
jgi:alkylation response protein AidB-like acyl-CoA dehydrogenase